MTMIVCAVTAEHVVMVSDRRLTVRETDLSASEIENKAVVLNNQWVLGYTGPGDIEEMPVDMWVVRILGSVAPEQYVATLAERATADIPDEDKRRPIAFLVAGWPSARDGALPIAVEISNFDYDEFGVPDRVFNHFSIKRLETPADDVSVLAVGALLIGPERAQVEERLRSCANQEGSHPLDIAEILGAEVRRNYEANQRVGNNLMVVSIPQAAVGQPLTHILNLDRKAWRHKLCAAYFGACADFVQYSPAAVLSLPTTEGPPRSVLFWGGWMSSEPDSYPLGPSPRRPLPLPDGGLPARRSQTEAP